MPKTAVEEVPESETKDPIEQMKSLIRLKLKRPENTTAEIRHLYSHESGLAHYFRVNFYVVDNPDDVIVMKRMTDSFFYKVSQNKKGFKAEDITIGDKPQKML